MRAGSMIGASMIAAGLIACGHGNAFGVEPSGGAEPWPSSYTEVARVRMVLLSVAVLDGRGRPVRGLGPEDFRLVDEGVVQQIDSVSTAEDLPLALAFLLDLSGSMGTAGKLERAKGAIRTLVDGLAPEDRCGLIGFADQQVTWITDFTRDRPTFLERLAVQEAYGRTALWDALAASAGLVDAGTQDHGAIVLLTDGLDNASVETELRAVWLARRAQVPIYVLRFIPFEEDLLSAATRRALGLLHRFAVETGGRLFPVHDSPDLGAALAAIRSDLGFRYVLGYYPTASGGNGAFRRIGLSPVPDGLVVRVRSGYYADP